VTEEPTGYILVNDAHMAFWLPEGITPEDIEVTDVGRSAVRDVEESPPF
jgi:hypothetical protein